MKCHYCFSYGRLYFLFEYDKCQNLELRLDTGNNFFVKYLGIF